MTRIFLTCGILCMMLLGSYNSNNDYLNGDIYPLKLDEKIIVCDYGVGKTDIIHSETDSYLAGVDLFDPSGYDHTTQLDSSIHFSYTPDLDIKNQKGTSIPYIVNGNGYSIKQNTDREYEIAINSEFSYKRIFIYIASKSNEKSIGALLVIRPDDPDYEYFFRE